MRITFFGHAAFLFEVEGRRIILDPYKSPDAGGYLPINEPADLVFVSHENDRYHSHLGQIVPPFEVARGLEFPPGGRSYFGYPFDVVRVYETPARKPEDEVTVLSFKAEGLHVVFLGDLGHPLTDEEIAPLKGADIVLVSAGGPPTIELAEIPPLLDAIDPRVIIPMHYLTDRINLKIQPPERLFEILHDWSLEEIEGSSVELHAGDMPPHRTILWLQPAR